MLLLDISEYYVAWQKEVREPIIDIVQIHTDISKAQKAGILDRVFERNQSLVQISAIKGGLSLLFLFIGVYLLMIFAKKEKPSFLNPALTIAGLIAVFMASKILIAMTVNTQAGANFITVDAGETSFKSIISKNFKGKVVYVDFWGTTCGPCLMEFDDFTHPVKEHYKNRSDLAYLYISGGNRYIWKKQIAKFRVTGFHLFLEEKEYNNLYRNAIGNDTAMVLMPHYLIINKQGEVDIPAAARPSDQKVLFAQLDNALNK
ncbi:hypothetical protein GCM10007352_06170 [Mucilaginibacter phyllosphaerae]|nr:hypothetical protein GCM10007352_06170 [Mucilaginibacter phyllosphaerae]